MLGLAVGCTKVLVEDSTRGLAAVCTRGPVVVCTLGPEADFIAARAAGFMKGHQPGMGLGALGHLASQEFLEVNGSGATAPSDLRALIGGRSFSTLISVRCSKGPTAGRLLIGMQHLPPPID